MSLIGPGPIGVVSGQMRGQLSIAFAVPGPSGGADGLRRNTAASFGAVRRECLDLLLFIGAPHLGNVLARYEAQIMIIVRIRRRRQRPPNYDPDRVIDQGRRHVGRSSCWAHQRVRLSCLVRWDARRRPGATALN